MKATLKSLHVDGDLIWNPASTEVFHVLEPNADALQRSMSVQKRCVRLIRQYVLSAKKQNNKKGRLERGGLFI